MSAQLSAAKRHAIANRALAALAANRPVMISTDLTTVVAVIGQLQLAFRHPQNSGATRGAAERFARALVEQIDPAHGDVHAFLLMGFDERYDEEGQPTL
jgi:hypothetical protein